MDIIKKRKVVHLTRDTVLISKTGVSIRRSKVSICSFLLEKWVKFR